MSNWDIDIYDLALEGPMHVVWIVSVELCLVRIVPVRWYLIEVPELLLLDLRRLGKCVAPWDCGGEISLRSECCGIED